jgi:hypothetical protein
LLVRRPTSNLKSKVKSKKLKAVRLSDYRMKLKNKYIIAVALAGGALILFGSLRRIMHHPNADLLLNTGFYTLIAAVIFFTVKLLLNKEKNHFLNK